jgi:urease accessory protein
MRAGEGVADGAEVFSLLMNLRLLQLGDSALPIGGYSQSWGLEAAVESGRVRDAAGLEEWARDWLTYGVAPNEGVIVAAVCRSVSNDDRSAPAKASEILDASLSAPTLRHASREMGGQLLALAERWPWAAGTVDRLRKLGSERWHHAPVFAALAAAAPAAPGEALALYLHQAAAGVISAGVRSIPIGHTHGQQVLAALHETIRQLSERWADADLQSAGSFCPRYEVYCDAQSRLYTRLFRS